MAGVWAALETAAQKVGGASVAAAFAADSRRFDRLSCNALGLLLDFSRQRLDEATLELLLALPLACDLRGRIEAMYRGDPINASEGRAVLHVALRAAADEARPRWPAQIQADVLAERERMLAFAAAVRAGRVRSSAGQAFTHVINVGIGGSDLGPAMATEALRAFRGAGPRVSFVSNVDGCDLLDALERAPVAETLFVIGSKTFTTQETLANARTARAWIAAQLGEAAVPAHFAAVSVNAAAMNEFGVHPDYRFAMWDWVGGRYSLWSSIGVSLAIAIGADGFRELLAGGRDMDEHFVTADFAHNLPVLLALIGVWNINLLALPTLAVLPYDSRLKRFPAYLQQLDMESNGKRVTRSGAAVARDTAPVVWGEPGNNAQHSFFQLLHQGSARAAIDFLLPAKSSCGWQAHQELAIANCLAQAEAFMSGQQGVPPQRVHEGNRPSTVIAFERLDPRTLGKLVALYEHKVFVQSVLWDINAFDQFGVELGKKLCEGVLPLVRGAMPNALPPVSLRGLLDFLRSK